MYSSKSGIDVSGKTMSGELFFKIKSSYFFNILLILAVSITVILTAAIYNKLQYED